MKSLIRDPLLHFLLLGIALFVAFQSLNDASPDATLIRVTAAQQEQLAAAFERVWRRPPTTTEFKGLVDDWVREELANREAQRMGLADNDLVVRRRLRQKYEAFLDQIALSESPTDEALSTWYEEHAEDYREDARYTLRQRFFSSDRRQDAQADAADVLTRLEQSNPELDPRWGDALTLPRRLQNQPAGDVAKRFGPPFAAALAALPTGRWAGPVASAYGFHLVYIEEARASRLPSMAEIRDELRRDWQAQFLTAALEQHYSALLNTYEVLVEPPATTARP